MHQTGTTTMGSVYGMRCNTWTRVHPRAYWSNPHSSNTHYNSRSFRETYCLNYNPAREGFLLGIHHAREGFLLKRGGGDFMNHEQHTILSLTCVPMNFTFRSFGSFECGGRRSGGWGGGLASPSSSSSLLLPPPLPASP